MLSSLQFRTHNPVASPQLTFLFFKLSLASLCVSLRPCSHGHTILPFISYSLALLASGLTCARFLSPPVAGTLGARGWISSPGPGQGFRPPDVHLTFNTWSPAIRSSFYLPPSSHLSHP